MSTITINTDGSISIDAPPGEAIEMLAKAMTLKNGVGYPKPKLPASTTKIVPVPPTDDAKTLLRAGGYQMIRPSTLAIYSCMLTSPDHVWSIGEIAKRTKLDNQQVSHIICAMYKRGVVQRIEDSLYKVK